MNEQNSGGLREKASGLTSSAKQRASSLFDSQKSSAVSEVNQLADALRRVGGEMQDSRFAGSLINMAADKLQSLGSGIENRGLDELKDDVERFARRNPAAFIGGALVLGVMAARFLKSHGRAQAGFDTEMRASSMAATDIETPISSSPTTSVGSDFGVSGSSGMRSSNSGISTDFDDDRGGVIR